MPHDDSTVINFATGVVCDPGATGSASCKHATTPARYRQLLQRFDVNKNGQLDPQERAVIRRIQAQQSGDNPQTRPQMQRPQNQTPAQPNATGQCRGTSQFQFRKRENKLDRTRLLNRFDTNGDGQLGADEREYEGHRGVS